MLLYNELMLEDGVVTADFFGRPAKKISPRAILAVSAVSLVLVGAVFFGIKNIESVVTPLSANAALSQTSGQTPLIAPVQTQLNQFVLTQNTPYGIVVINLKNGETSSINPDQQFTSASFYKLFVAQGILDRVDKGQLNLTQKTSTGQSVDDCLRVMINISDNNCGQALGEIVGWQTHDAALHELGFTNTSLSGNDLHTTAEDAATFFKKLYAGQLLSQAGTGKLLGYLKEQKVNNRLPLGLPGGTTFAHKTGDLDGLMHDGGIVYGPKTDYVIVAMSGPWQHDTDSFAQFANLSSRVYGLLQ